MANRFPLRRTPWTTLMWFLSAPVATIAVVLVIAAALVAGGMSIGRWITPPKVYKQVTVTAPALAQRADNADLSTASLTCTGTPDLKLALTVPDGAKRGSVYLTVKGSRQYEAAGQSDLALDVPSAQGDYDISYTGPAGTSFEFSTTGDGACRKA